MKVGNCPSCGAPVEFRPGAGQVKVCEHCQTVVLRGDANLTALGRVAQLADTQSPLKLNLSGRYREQAFTVVGRLQKSHGHGVWDEWCLAFDDGGEGWLSESEGQWRLMRPAGEVDVPTLDKVRPAMPLTLKGTRFVVEEVGEATVTSADGQLPSFDPRHPYVDATAPNGVFGSLDYGGETPELYVGHDVALSQLGFDASELQPTPKREQLRQARCTNCNGPLELKAPDRTKRVACPFCGALLDVSAGELSFLQLLDKPPYEPRIPLGASGLIKGQRWVCLAFLIRSCRVEGTRYGWEEYLLFSREHGFRWLMLSNGHWSFLTPINAGDVVVTGKSASYQGQSYKQYQSVVATTEYVVGECYWEVSAGETAFASEYVCPPKSLNVDLTANEVTFTLGELLSKDEVVKAFGLKTALPSPQGIAPAQLNPHEGKVADAFKWAAIWAAALLAVAVVFAVGAPTGTYADTTVTVPADAKPGSPEAMVFSEPFEIPKKTPLQLQVIAPGLDNSWLGVQIDLVNEATDEVISLYAEPSYYSGSDSDGFWSEGSRDQSKTTDEVDAGRYVLRTTASFDPMRPVRTFRVKLSADGPGACLPITLLLVLFAWPVALAMLRSSFETKRWEDSVYQSNPFGLAAR